MRWTGDVATGDWLKPLIDDPWRFTMHDVVPRGFQAYARVFHPASRDRPVGRSWPHGSYDANAREWDRFNAQEPEIETAAVTWTEVAEAFGTTMHPNAQWNRLVRATSDEQAVGDPQDAAGWRYQQPDAGDLDAGILTLLAAVLARFTTTPESGAAALWEGWGGLLGGFGTNGRTMIQMGGDGAEPGRDFLAQSTPDWFNDVFRRANWHDGILSREISEAARLELPGRSYVVFEGGIRDFASPEWETTVPWRDLPLERYGFPPEAHSPSIVWPDDHAWVLVSEVDFDSTIIAGSSSLIDAVCATPGVEASEIPAGSRLTWDSDEVNR